ncbi:methylated-DNA--[protein]-cysteine S-methyltransferase [Adlercreutzia sp. ZJ473]|uniref:methylated-DNA--[protein]-cysteine S-methyltransferase n=1 Tax=Adlercreutzia sp. ZJ473 TaxID=2722822 RepID=UPI001556E77D|nr:methylated-DNA--[protein]-cysteine S-methyltransferase [Adlercreutzia sp. ZJ473]
MYCCSEYDSPMGKLTIASDGVAVCGLWLEGQKYHGATVSEEMVRSDEAGGLAELRAWLDAYFAGERPDPASVPLAPIGSEFRQAVWQKLLEIPYGELTTYGAIAQALKEERGKASALAVGGAVGHNPISIIIPCHRVVGADGSLTGYAGGLARKTWLLEHEGVDMGNLYAPKKGTAL